MPKFRKKPVVIEAMVWDGSNYEEIAVWCGKTDKNENGIKDPGSFQRIMYGIVGVLTLEGFMVAKKGDWIIKGVKGEFYPVKPDVFAATYEAVE